MSENSQDLLPCPFCGGEPELKHLGRHYGASCSDWKCQGMQGALMHLDEQSAVNAWNKRAAPVAASATAKDAERWRWARTVLMSMTFLSGRHHSGTTSVCPCDDHITSRYWDRIADRAIAATGEKA